MRYPISAVIAIATAVAVLNVTLVKAVAMTVATLTNDKTVAVVVAESIYHFQVGKIQSWYGVLERSLSSADCYSIKLI